MKAILVAVTTAYDKYDIQYSLDELANLAEAIEITPVYRVYQKLTAPNAKTYVGKGKLDEIAIAIAGYEADIVIFNDELTPSQLRNTTEILNVTCIDRSFLILQIFEKRAQTHEATLEIKLAKNLYLLPRLALVKGQESRSGGASGSMSSKGAGETQAELDRRHLMAEIRHLKQELNDIQTMKLQQIQKRQRNEIPIVALVGYTNAGKSSTMNTILEFIKKEDKNVFVKNQLFATLSTYNRKITFDKKDFILTDTIGFVSKLPHHLVMSFHQTLAEIKNADLIIHVLDSSSKYINEQLDVVMDVLSSLDIKDVPHIFLLNKWDETIDTSLSVPGYESIPFSNKTKLNVDKLLNTILTHIGPSTLRVKLLIPYTEGKLSHILETTSHIYQKEYQNYGTYYDVELPIKEYDKYRKYDIDTMVN